VDKFKMLSFTSVEVCIIKKAFEDYVILLINFKIRIEK